jgi:hypothetical protein
MGFPLSQYAFVLPLGIPLHYACANSLEPLNILNAIPS